MMRLSLRLGSLLVLFAVACGDSNFQQVRPSMYLSSTEDVDFGSNPVLLKISRTIEVGNIGKAPLNLSMSIIPGTGTPLDGDAGDAGDGGIGPEDLNVFFVEAEEGDLPTQLANGQSVKIVLSFMAAKQGRYTGTFVVDSDDPDQPRVEIPLTGAATTAAAIDVQPTDCVDFGRVGESRSLVKEVTVTSVGTAPLTLGQLEIAGEDGDAFAILGSKVGGTIDVTTPPSSVKIQVKFAPVAALANENGELTADLVLSTNDPLRRVVNVCLKGTINRQPIADGRIMEPQPGQNLVPPGATVLIDASTSTDPDMDLPLTFQWSARKDDGTVVPPIGNDTDPTFRFKAMDVGVYTVQLEVTDAAGLKSKVQRITINAAADNRVRVELIWDHPVADLDLHMRPVGTALNSVSDCYGYNQQPTDWGSIDPPLHYGDKLSGFGPEIIDYTEPADGRYQITIVYTSAQGAADKELTATVRVYQFGVVRSELSKKMTTPGERWDTGVLTWPSGSVTPGTGTP